MFTEQEIQKEGMGKELYDNFPLAKKYFEEANEVLGWRISDVMFFGSKIE